MRWRPLLLTLGLTALALAIAVSRAVSGRVGQDIWKVRLAETSSDHWVMLDSGSIRMNGHLTAVFLLAHPKGDASARRYDAMKVVGGTAGTTLWSYEGPGSNYVDAGARERNDAGDEVAHGGVPRLMDVDGDGSDDVVFVEQDFALGQLLRAVRIEP